MNPELQQLIKKSLRRAYTSLKESEHLFNNGYFNGSVSRAYISMYHSAAAMLQKEGYEVLKPSALVSFFERQIVKQGLIEPKYQALLNSVYENYRQVEFDAESSIGLEQAKQSLNNAQTFLSRVLDFFKETYFSYFS